MRPSVEELTRMVGFTHPRITRKGRYWRCHSIGASVANKAGPVAAYAEWARILLIGYEEYMDKAAVDRVKRGKIRAMKEIDRRWREAEQNQQD